MCYVVELSSLSKVKNFLLFLFFSVSAGGKKDAVLFAVLFAPHSREGNFGLHSTRFNYSKFYGGCLEW